MRIIILLSTYIVTQTRFLKKNQLVGWYVYSKTTFSEAADKNQRIEEISIKKQTWSENSLLLLFLNLMQNQKSSSKCSSSYLLHHFIVFHLWLCVTIVCLHGGSSEAESGFFRSWKLVTAVSPTSEADPYSYIN